MTKKKYKSIYLFCKSANMKDQKKSIFENGKFENGKLCECIITPEMKKRFEEQEKRIKMVVNPKSETLVIRIDG